MGRSLELGEDSGGKRLSLELDDSSSPSKDVNKSGSVSDCLRSGRRCSQRGQCTMCIHSPVISLFCFQCQSQGKPAGLLYICLL